MGVAPDPSFLPHTQKKKWPGYMMKYYKNQVALLCCHREHCITNTFFQLRHKLVAIFANRTGW